MNIYLFRYNENYYITKGIIEEKVDSIFSLFDVKYIDNKFIIQDISIVTKLILFPVKNKKNLLYISKNSSINFIFLDNVEQFIYTGSYDEVLIENSLISFKDEYGNNIYINNFSKNNKLIKLIEDNDFYYNHLNINPKKFKINRKLYLEDFIKNTPLNFDKKYNKLFFNNKEYLNMLCIINRLCLLF